MTNFFTRFRDNSAFIEIRGNSQEDTNDYFVEFIDLNTNNIEYSSTLKVNYWSKIENIIDKNITIRVTLYNEVVFERNQNYKFNRVYIKIGSGALGDNIAWMPYLEEYRKVYNTNVIVYCPHKYLFDKVYNNIEFTEISEPYDILDVDKRFRIDYGPKMYIYNNRIDEQKWLEENEKYDNYVDYFDHRELSLQKIASNILGLPPVEIKSLVNIPDDNGPKIKGKYVVVAIQSTAQMKYWNNPFGWQTVFDFLGKNGYKIVLIDRHKNFGVINYFNQAPKSKYVIDKTGNYPLSDRITDLKYADMTITISSGLSWLSWAVGTPVVMISGCTKPFNEFQSNIVRVYNSTVCSGCWNDVSAKFNPFDWLSCPKNNDFICSKAIQSKDVTDAIKKLIK